MFLKLVVSFLLLSLGFVRAQQPWCWVTARCTGEITQQRSNVQDCCLRSPSLGYQTTEGCSACVVYGFTETSLVLRESPDSYSVMVGVAKGFNEQFFAARQLVYTVRVLSGDTTAVQGEDYVFQDTTISLSSPGPFPVSLTIPEDELSQEPDRTLVLELVLTSSRLQEPISPGTVRISRLDITIVDASVPTVNLTFEDASVVFSENSGGGEVCILATGSPFVRSIPILVTFENGTATGGSDFQYPSSDLVMLSGAARNVCVEVDIIADGLYEDDEMFVIRMSTTDEDAIIVQPTVSVLIENSDSITVGFVRTNYLVSEGDGFVDVCMDVLSGSLGRELSLRLVPTATTATSGSDFNSSSTELVFAPFSTRSCARIQIIDDDEVEALTPETFTVTATPTQGASSSVAVNPAMAEVSIEDNEPVTIQFVGGVDASEGSQFQVCLVKSSVTIEEFVVDISVRNGTAQDGEDYMSSQIPSVVTFPPSVRMVCLNITLPDDSEALEPVRSFSLIIDDISPSSSRVSSPVNMVEINVVDDDDLLITPLMPSITVQEALGVAEVCLEADPMTYNGNVVVQISYRSNSATATEDFDPDPSAVLFENSISEVCFNVTINRDGFLERDAENFTILLSAPNPRVTIAPNAVEVTIVDSDAVTLRWLNETNVVSEGVGEVTLCAALTGSLAVPVSVDVLLDPERAMPGQDFVADARPSSLSFMPGGSTIQCTVVDIIDDDVIERINLPESLFVRMVNAMPSSRVFFQPHEFARIFITDNEEIRAGFGSASIVVDESDKEFVYCFNKTTPETILFTISVTPGSAMEGSDYLPDVFPEEFQLAGVSHGCQLSGDVIVDNDVGLEPDKFFILTINSTNPQNDRIVFHYPQLQVIIRDNDMVVVEFASSNFQVSEAAGVVTVCIIKNLQLATPLDVEIHTMSQTALAGIDYQGGMYSLTFLPEDGSSKCFNITVLPDNIIESNERFSLALRLPSGTSQLVQLGTAANATVTIVDPVPQINVNDTVTGDPVMTVPILVSDDQLSAVGDGSAKSLSLCYEVHGVNNTWFNMITDQCTTVNARYSASTPELNIINEVGIRAVDGSSGCVAIDVKVDDCSVSVNSMSLPVMGRYNMAGVSVRRYSNRVRVSVPNCADQTLVMWMMCRETHFPYDAVTAKLINFVVMRGLNHGRKAHGILGQFWNNPVDVIALDESDSSGLGAQPTLPPALASDKLYKVTISTAAGVARSYVGELRKVTWEHREEACLYVGDSQGGPVGDPLTPNDGVLDGNYLDYVVDNGFSEQGPFKFGLFEEFRCSTTK